MEMPLRCSSSSRSVSVPVIRRTSVVLPWSTCPAVPMVREMRLPSGSPKGALYRPGYRSVIAGQQGPGVEPDPPVVNPTDHGRIGFAELLRQSLGLRPTEADGEVVVLVQMQIPPAPPGDA